MTDVGQRLAYSPLLALALNCMDRCRIAFGDWESNPNVISYQPVFLSS
jgi:hypothetical protein